MEYTMHELLGTALKDHYAIPAICVSNMESVLACFIAAERERSPVIIQSAFSEMEPHMITCADLAGIIRTFGARYKNVPYCIHLDHGMSENECISAINQGFPSVMFDGSSLPYEENVTITRNLKMLAGSNRTVEAEVGKVGGEEGGSPDGESNIVESDPEQLRDFICRTGADAIAVSIGNIHGCHGIVKRAPRLNFELLDKLHNICNIPLVLHGASGIPATDIQKAVTMGISKVNYYTQLYVTYMASMKENINLTMEECMGKATAALANEIASLMKMCGSAGQG